MKSAATSSTRSSTPPQHTRPTVRRGIRVIPDGATLRTERGEAAAEVTAAAGSREASPTPTPTSLGTGDCSKPTPNSLCSPETPGDVGPPSRDNRDSSVSDIGPKQGLDDSFSSSTA